MTEVDLTIPAILDRTKPLKLKSPYADLLPPLTTTEFEALEASIQAEGVRDPISIDEDGNILDGHNRYRIKPNAPRRIIAGLTDAGKRAFVLASNFNRRNLSPDQKAVLREKQKAIAADLKAEGQTQEQIAAMLGVAQQTVSAWLIPNTSDGNAHKEAPPDARVKLTQPAKAKVLERVDSGESQEQIAADFGVSQAQVSRIAAAEKKRLENEALKQKTKEVQAAEGRYGTIVIDPPWDMQKIERDVAPNQSGFEYPTMSEDELAKFQPMLELPADDCHVFCWTTHKHLPSALRLIETWGLHYVCVFVWHKSGGFQPFGLPQYNCEFVVYARRGSPKFISLKKFFCCFNGDRREHSRKPDEFYDMVRRVTDGRRIDIFSRERRDGFDGYGNEADKFAEAG